MGWTSIKWGNGNETFVLAYKDDYDWNLTIIIIIFKIKVTSLMNSSSKDFKSDLSIEAIK